MRFLVLGGCGIMGASVVRDLIKGEDVKTIILADRKIDKNKLHKSITDNSKVSMENVNVEESEQLKKLMSECDVVINCVGPYYKYGIPVMKSAIEAGVNYLDIMDDYDTTIDALELDEAAKKAGISVCIGYGSSPGFGNIIAKYAGDKLDQVEEIRLLWGYALNDPTGPSVMSHMLHALSGNVPQYLDGKLVYVSGGSGGEEIVNFSEPYGKCPVYYLGHPEPITMPRYFKGIKTVVNKGCFLPLWTNDFIMELMRNGFSDNKEMIINEKPIIPREFLVQMLMAEKFRSQVEAWKTAPLEVIVKGTKGHKNVTYIYESDGRMAPGTAIPASICAQMLAKGEIIKKGVVPPETCVDPKLFFLEFKKRGFCLSEKKIEIGDADIYKGGGEKNED